MKSFMRGVLGSASGAGGSAAGRAMAIYATPQPLHYSLSAFRWHLDTRPPKKVIAIHDFLSTSGAWEQFLNESIAGLPLARLTPTEPLEVYSVDLRGHNFSETVKLAEGENLAEASAADVALLQRDILKTEASLVGIGFGAMVACEAALHSPDNFANLVLFVRHFSQVFECNPADYGARTVLRDAPTGPSSLRDLNAYLKDKIPNDMERAVLLSAVDETNETARFRFSDEVLKADKPLLFSANSEEAQFNKPVNVFVADAKEKPPTQDELARFKKLFPQGKVMQFNTQGEALGSSNVPLAPLLLQYLNVLGEVATEEQQ